VKGIEGSWSIRSPVEGFDYDGLKDFFDKNKGKAAACIRYYTRNAQVPALVGASILMPQPAFNDLITLFRTINGNANLKYVIDLEFFGFKPHDVQASETRLRSVSEFVNPDVLVARPYFSDEVRISVVGTGLVSASIEKDALRQQCIEFV
jgi:hypothetical protein